MTIVIPKRIVWAQKVGLNSNLDFGLDVANSWVDETCSENERNENSRAPSSPPTKHAPLLPNTQPSTFHLFVCFDENIHRLIVKQMLVSDGVITNPWMQHNLDQDQHTYQEYGWNEWVNLSFLAVSKEWHEIGVKMLYEYNTFRFTRQVPAIGYRNLVNRTRSFLAKQRTIYSPTEDPKRVTRASLIKHIIIQDLSILVSRSASLHSHILYKSLSFLKACPHQSFR